MTTDDYLAPTIATYDRTVEQYVQSTAKLVLYEEIEKFAKLMPPKARILDAGCAWGRDSKLFVERGYDVTGIDLSEGFLVEALKRVLNAKFINMDLRAMDFPDNSFEGIWACASLLHLTLADIQKVLNDFFRILSPGGTVFLHVKRGLGDNLGTRSQTVEGERFFVYLEPEQLNGMAESAGFSIVETYLFSERERYGSQRRDMWWVMTFARKN